MKRRGVGGRLAARRSVFWKYQSLFIEKISLFLFLGNLRKNPDEPLEICSGSAAKAVNFAKFPVKFPVSREWRSETGPICTGSPANQSSLSIFSTERAIKPANTRYFERRSVSEAPGFEPKYPALPEASRAFLGNGGFAESKSGEFSAATARDLERPEARACWRTSDGIARCCSWWRRPRCGARAWDRE
jgi:hypothetical protein